MRKKLIRVCVQLQLLLTVGSIRDPIASGQQDRALGLPTTYYVVGDLAMYE